MSILSRFARAPAPTPPPPPQKAVGGSGRGHTQGFIQWEELNQDLIGFQGLQVYDRMYRTDPDVRKVMAMAFNPIVQGTWEVEPYGGKNATAEDERVAEAVRWMLFEFLGAGLGLKGHLSEAMPVLMRSGFCPFEQLWGPADWEQQTLLACRKLALRLPRSVWRWPQDDDGDLTEVWQFLPQKGQVELAIENLVYYRVGAEGDNWEGVSMLRPAYKPWYIKDRLEKIDATGQELEALGIALLYPPPTTGDFKEQLDDLETKLQGLGIKYLIMPGPSAQYPDAQGWHMEMLDKGGSGSKGSGRDAMPTLAYHKDAISASFISEFMRLGQGKTGARATADTQEEPHALAVMALADVPAGQLQATIVRRFVELNFPDATGVPGLGLSKADEAAMEVLAQFITTLTTAGWLHPDDTTEDHLRERADLPPVDPAERAARKALEQKQQDMEMQAQRKQLDAPVPQPKPASGGPATASAEFPEAETFARQDRQLRGFEQLMSLDHIEASIDQARARFEQAGGDAARRLAATYAQAVANGKDPNQDPPSELVDALTHELGVLYATGRQTVADELHAQGAPLTHSTFAAGDVAGTVARRAALAARSIATRVYQAITRLHLSGRKSLADLQRAGELEAGAGLRQEAQLHAAAALNEGRDDEAQANAELIKGARYTSILDQNRCQSCSAADDDVLRPLTDPVRLAHRPPNPDCFGGGRCRCVEFFELKGEVAPSA